MKIKLLIILSIVSITNVSALTHLKDEDYFRLGAAAEAGDEALRHMLQRWTTEKKITENEAEELVEHYQNYKKAHKDPADIYSEENVPFY